MKEAIRRMLLDKTLWNKTAVYFESEKNEVSIYLVSFSDTKLCNFKFANSMEHSDSW